MNQGDDGKTSPGGAVRHDQWRLYRTDDLDFDYEEGEDYPRADAVSLSIAV